MAIASGNPSLRECRAMVFVSTARCPMTYVLVSPEIMASVAADVHGIGALLANGNAAAAATTTNVASAAADEVSTAIATLFSQYAKNYQVVAGQAAAFHDQFTNTLLAGANSYVSAEAATVADVLLGVVNAPTQALLGRPLIGNGANGTTVNGVGTPAGPADSCTATAATAGRAPTWEQSAAPVDPPA
ncbi:PE family protein [Mycobacterium kansasii]|uniref:PE family protein n=2 Tax=Mycobacterium kansasii TaxID=1768 RepID=A0A1V3WSA4_MYCKA|nr:PE family protein [Mycobacterium kansasii]